MRIVLHTGKGGVGKTTISAATAIAAAGAGHRTLLLSTDPAHSVSDVLDAAVGKDPTPVAGVEGLWAAQVDTRARFEQAWSGIREFLVGILAARGLAEVQAEELTVLPGADEVIALLEVHRYAEAGEFDVIVVDCAPSGESLRLLALPETIEFYSERLMATPVRLMRGLVAGFAGRGQDARRRGQDSGAPVSAGQLTDALGVLLDNLKRARNLLADSTITGIRIVVSPERVVVAEARRLLTALALHGFSVDAVMVNRLLPDAAEGEFLQAWRAGQAVALQSIDESFPQLPRYRAELTATEPIGIASLAALGAELFGGIDPVAGPVPDAGFRVEGADGRYRLMIELPLVDRGEVDLSRAGDDLVITVGPHRRRIGLPSVLLRCRTTGARFVGGALVVDFVPDTDRWPKNLVDTLPADMAGAR